MSRIFNLPFHNEQESHDVRRLERLISQFNCFGGDEAGGLNRPGYGDAEAQAVEAAAAVMRELGLQPTRDAALNLFGTAYGALHEAEAVVFSGSHLDTVPGGGSYDGVLGVACALEAVRLLQETDTADRFGVAVWRNEESSRFGVGCMGSRLATGVLSAQDIRRLRDSNGVSAYDAIRSLGGDPEQASRADELARQIGAFIEVHVDQSSFLHERGYPIGVVTQIISPAKIWVRFRGAAEHAGAAPPSKRRDALKGANALMAEVYRMADGLCEDQARLTVGAVQVSPNAVNVVPAEVKIGIDLRCASNDERDALIDMISLKTEAVSERFGLNGTVDILTRGGAFTCSERLVETIENAAKALRIPICRMASFAGHDARVIGDVVPSAMILVANPAGVSHTPEEAVDMGAAVAATRVLAAAMYHLAEVGETVEGSR